jgi:hypothetical protein
MILPSLDDEDNLRISAMTALEGDGRTGLWDRSENAKESLLSVILMTWAVLLRDSCVILLMSSIDTSGNDFGGDFGGRDDRTLDCASCILSPLSCNAVANVRF